jgi:serine protease 16
LHRYGLTEENKWVTWGGSYPGMLAGWARLKYPHLFHAAVASSAPVKAQLDFQGYVERSGVASQY